MDHWIVTWYLDAGPKGNPQGTDRSDYLRTAVTFFASSVRNNPNARHEFISDMETLPVVDGVDIRAFLVSLGVRITLIPHTFVPPADYSDSWQSQFYIMDMLAYLGGSVQDSEVLVLLDSDCVWIGSANPLVEAIANEGILAFDTMFSESFNNNGLTRVEMGEVFRQMVPPVDQPVPKSAGGEMLGVTSARLRELADLIPSLWTQMINAYELGKPRFLTEEHWLTYLYYVVGGRVGGGNSYIRRIWTGLPPKPRTARLGDYDLLIWHVPAEKRYGLRRLFRQSVNPNSEFWTVPTGSDFARYCGSYLGIPRRNMQKTFLDVLDAVSMKANRVR